MSFAKGWTKRRAAAEARRMKHVGRTARIREAAAEQYRRDTIASVYSVVVEAHQKLIDRQTHLQGELDRYRVRLARGESVSGFNPIVQELEALAPKIAAAAKTLKPAEVQYRRDMKASDDRLDAMNARHLAEMAAEQEAAVAAEAAMQSVMKKVKSSQEKADDDNAMAQIMAAAK